MSVFQPGSRDHHLRQMKRAAAGKDGERRFHNGLLSHKGIRGWGTKHIPERRGGSFSFFGKVNIFQAHCGQKGRHHHSDTWQAAANAEMSMFVKGTRIKLVGTLGKRKLLSELW